MAELESGGGGEVERLGFWEEEEGMKEGRERLMGAATEERVEGGV